MMATFDEPSFEVLGEILAQDVYARQYEWEDRVNLPPIQTLDTACASYLQIPAAALESIGLLMALDDYTKRYAFCAAPDNFLEVIAMRNDGACTRAFLIFALYRYLDHFGASLSLVSRLYEIGWATPRDSRLDPKWLISDLAERYRGATVYDRMLGRLETPLEMPPRPRRPTSPMRQKGTVPEGTPEQVNFTITRVSPGPPPPPFIWAGPIPDFEEGYKEYSCLMARR